ncbi:hypothetical protein LCGC14_1569680, partial [marine sediment metagenome]
EHEVNRQLALNALAAERDINWLNVMDEKMIGTGEIIRNVLTSAFSGLGNAVIAGIESGKGALQGS